MVNILRNHLKYNCLVEDGKTQEKRDLCHVDTKPSLQSTNLQYPSGKRKNKKESKENCNLIMLKGLLNTKYHPRVYFLSSYLLK